MPARIPIADLLDGCSLCLQNALEFAKEADLLLSKGYQTHAYGLVILGFQELGKFGELLEGYVNGIRNDTEYFVATGFYNHRVKMQARMKHYLASERETDEYEKRSKMIPPLTMEEKRQLRIYASPSYLRSVRTLERDGEAERLAATYVGFGETGEWLIPRAPKKEVVEAHCRMLAAEAVSLELTLEMKDPFVTLMAWKAEKFRAKRIRDRQVWSTDQERET